MQRHIESLLSDMPQLESTPKSRVSEERIQEIMDKLFSLLRLDNLRDEPKPERRARKKERRDFMKSLSGAEFALLSDDPATGYTAHRTRPVKN